MTALLQFITYSFPGESHDFWEFLCVDKGEVEITADNRAYTLKKGEIIFHKPNEFHTVRANGKIAPNLVVISFDCTSPCMDYFQALERQSVISLLRLFMRQNAVSKHH